MVLKENLLVTLADENYIDQAKQLFSSVYWNAGWKGDYMLLAHEIPESKLRWFRKKGILIRGCKPFFRMGSKDFEGWPVSIFSKFYLFTPEFRKWKNIIYLDSDIIVRASLEGLTRVNGFAAREKGVLEEHFLVENNALFKKIKTHYDLKQRAFNSGVFAFSTEIIGPNTFQRLKVLIGLCSGVCKFPDQCILNLYFYNNWKGFPIIFNFPIYEIVEKHDSKLQDFDGVVLHFTGKEKPWNPRNYFYKEWKHNFEIANEIDLKHPRPERIFSQKDIISCSLYLRRKERIYVTKRNIGKIGVFLRKKHPWLYFKLKRLENEIITWLGE